MEFENLLGSRAGRHAANDVVRAERLDWVKRGGQRLWEVKSGLPVIADGLSLAHAPSHPSEAPAARDQIGQNSFSRLSALTRAGKPPRPPSSPAAQSKGAVCKESDGIPQPTLHANSKTLTVPHELLLMIASFKPFDELRLEIAHQNKGATAYLVWSKYTLRASVCQASGREGQSDDCADSTELESKRLFR